MSNSIVVIGSSNTDMVVRTARFPSAGETILGGNFLMNAGGKGANQAVAAARLGGKVTFVCKTGNDIFGKQALTSFAKEGIDISFAVTDPGQPSGVALIMVDDHAENVIVVAPGANGKLLKADIKQVEERILSADYLLMQLETPLETVAYAAEFAYQNGIKVVLNPAPAQKLPADLFKHIAIITPNEKEAGMLTGTQIDDIESVKRAALKLYGKGVETIIITMGSRGALVLNDDTFTHIKSPLVEAVDTTAAGDVFNGALVVALSERRDLIAAVEFACQASAIAVTRHGAQNSAPYREEVGQLINSLSR
ncbi:ribokinase [Pedobacter helvus]|uniref:Ribokinase n=1 Tax=Pedobacter helvus TaxID=2563444 RepID=A0ABW9JMW4_9SPHI|nr:ribokinase [Pedobacter ureilyticus]